MVILRAIILFCGLILLWQLIVTLFQLPVYILPSPFLVFKTWIQQAPLILSQTYITVIETLLGLFFGVLIGAFGALMMIFFNVVRFWMLPLLIISQAIPTFAIAPLLVVWLGYGMASKIVTTMIMIFFPVTATFFDGLRRTPQEWLDLASTMNANRWNKIWHIQVPAAMPAFASGLRVATAIAPIGAIIGEWVGSSRGLGFLMLNANARLQIDMMFAALFTLIIFSLLLYFSVDKLLKHFIFWQVER